jgi:signal transduction histidine kinase
MSRLALRARVAFASVLVLALGTIAIGVAINVLLTDRLSADADAVLRARADAQQATLDVQDGRLVVREGTQDEALDREAWVFDRSGRVVAHPRASAALDREAAALARAGSSATRNVPGEVRLLAEPALARDGRERVGTVVVAVSLAPYERSETIARTGTVVLALFVLLAGALVAWRAVGSALRPVAAMARQARDYSEHDLSGRFATGTASDELATLATTLNALLERLAASLSHEQRLTAEIAHELRTPLSGIRAEAELALVHARSPEDAHAALRSIVESADRMNGAIDALLTAGRHLEAGSASCSLHEAILLATTAVGPDAAGAGVQVSVGDVPERARVGADPAFVAQTLNPLLDNAIRHAETNVGVTAGLDARMAQIRIEDDGPGIRAEDVDAIFQPGWETSGGSGAGLGLALARRLARSLGGDVRNEPVQRGALMVVELPLVDGMTREV